MFIDPTDDNPLRSDRDWAAPKAAIGRAGNVPALRIEFFTVLPYEEPPPVVPKQELAEVGAAAMIRPDLTIKSQDVRRNAPHQNDLALPNGTRGADLAALRLRKHLPREGEPAGEADRHDKKGGDPTSDGSSGQISEGFRRLGEARAPRWFHLERRR
jgi:hypothetical protein